MQFFRVKTYEEMSRKAADILAAQVMLKPRCVLGLATGSTPIGMYENLVEEYKEGRLDFSQVKTVNLDEYCGLGPDDDQGYRYFMEKHLFKHVNVKPGNTHVPDGLAKDKNAVGRAYDEMIEDMGGIDLQVLGIGNNGHIGFNEPADHFTAGTHVVNLKESTIQANSRFFEDISQVPTQAVTMGMRSIMQAKRVLLLANKDKIDIVERAAFGLITPQVPASLLQLHSNLTVILVDPDGAE